MKFSSGEPRSPKPFLSSLHTNRQLPEKELEGRKYSWVPGKTLEQLFFVSL